MLASKGGSSFPFVWFLDHEGALIGERFFPKDEESLQKAHAKAEADLKMLNGLRESVAKNAEDKIAKATLAIEMALRHGDSAPGAEQLKELAKTDGLDAALVKKVESFINVSQVQDLMNKAVAMLPTAGQPAAQAFLRTEYTKLFKSGLRISTADPRLFMNYLSFAMQGAAQDKNAELATEIVKVATEAEANQRFIDHLTKQAATLKGASDDKEDKDEAKEEEEEEEGCGDDEDGCGEGDDDDG